MIIEINATDGDAGFQAKGDAEGWRTVKIHGPDGKKIFDTKARRSLRKQELTEIFFESEEPSCEEVPLSKFLMRFPEGEYRWWGRTIEGDWLEGEATLTHDLPGAPEITGPVEASVVDSGSEVKIEWEPGEGVGECEPEDNDNLFSEAEDIFGYQIVVEREAPEPLIVFTVDLTDEAREVTIPSEFLEEGAIYKFEVIAIEARGDDEDNGLLNGEVERGNQTISESFFCISGIEGHCELPD